MNDKYFLNLALSQAKIRRGFCSPNPSVGSIIVDQNLNVVAEGYHFAAGHPHAERVVLQRLNSKDQSLTLYVTLEPCVHWGKTPPCVEAIRDANIKRVVYGFKDPNPLVSGKGAIFLQDLGIQCDHVNLKSINDFYESYEFWHATQRPFVTAKIAMSLNGMIAEAEGKPRQITGEALSVVTHRCRKAADAILTSIETVLNDNPRLDARVEGEVFAKPVYVLDTHLRFPLTCQLLQTAASVTVFHDSKVTKEKREKLIQFGIRCIEIDTAHNGLNLHQVIQWIGKEGIQDLWIESGGKSFAAFVEARLVQRAYIYISLRWFKHGKIAFPEGISLYELAKKVRWRRFGQDVMCEIRF